MLASETQCDETGSAGRRGLPLENGESMHSREFLDRYERMPGVKKAELIEGVVFMGSPVSVLHSKPDALIHGWLVAYASHHPGTEVHANVTVLLDADNTVQPDALLRRLPEQGGATRVNEEGYLAGPPEVIVEIASSSASIDLRDKRRACCRNGVRDYVVWLVAEGRLEWFCLEGDEYVAQRPDADGLLHSRAFPRLRWPVATALAGQSSDVLTRVPALEPTVGPATAPPDA